MVVRALVPPSGTVRGHAFRLEPNDSLKESLCEIASIIFARLPEKESSSLFMMTAVGSLKDVTLRLANASKKSMDGNESKKSNGNDIKQWLDQRFEIVSLVGTFSRDGSCHLHLSISDAEGNSFGGHLIAGIVFTTCEVVIGSIDGVNFQREEDERTGYKELIPKQILNNESWIQIQNVAKLVVLVAIGYSLGTFSKPRQR
jgi:predicted DNA-binding protein with PD1-like motif